MREGYLVIVLAVSRAFLWTFSTDFRSISPSETPEKRQSETNQPQVLDMPVSWTPGPETAVLWRSSAPRAQTKAP
jgi:hypothetical protein